MLDFVRGHVTDDNCMMMALGSYCRFGYWIDGTVVDLLNPRILHDLFHCGSIIWFDGQHLRDDGSTPVG